MESKYVGIESIGVEYRKHLKDYSAKFHGKLFDMQEIDCRIKGKAEAFKSAPLAADFRIEDASSGK